MHNVAKNMRESPRARQFRILCTHGEQHAQKEARYPPCVEKREMTPSKVEIGICEVQFEEVI